MLVATSNGRRPMAVSQIVAAPPSNLPNAPKPFTEQDRNASAQMQRTRAQLIPIQLERYPIDLPCHALRR